MHSSKVCNGALGVVLALVSASAGAQTAQNPWAGPPGPPRGAYVDVNGLHLYYEVHGVGQPLVLLHGGLGAGSMFGQNIPALAKRHRVILVDLQGHGRTADIDRPLTLEALAEDVVALLKRLGISQADVMGYSFGGGVAAQVAIRHPDVVRRLIVVSSGLRPDATYPEMHAMQKSIDSSAAPLMKGTPMDELYRSVAPRPQDFPRLIGKIGAFMKSDYDYTAEFATVKAPTLIVVGDADMIMPAHAVEMFGLLGGGKRDGGWDGSGRSRSQLAILPGLTHYSIFNSPALAAVAIAFLDL